MYTDGDDLQNVKHPKVLAPPLQPWDVMQSCHIGYWFKAWSNRCGITIAILQFPSRTRDIDLFRGWNEGHLGATKINHFFLNISAYRKKFRICYGWRHIHLIKLQNDTPYDWIALLVWSLRGGANTLGASHLIIRLRLYFVRMAGECVKT